MVSVEDIRKASKQLLKILPPSPLLYNPWLSEAAQCEVYLKLENMQPIGSFKIRGAAYKILRLTTADKKKGVIAASAGNHAQGVAWAARKLEVQATIVMPKSAPLVKIQNTQALGATVILEGDCYEDAFALATSLSAKSGQIFIPAFEDRDIISGQGTIALEMLEQNPELECVIGSVGGGGLMAGIGTVYHTLGPKVRMVGCQASQAAAMMGSIQKGRPITLQSAHSFADGVSLARASEPMMKLLIPLIDEWVQASEEEIAAGILHLMEKAKVIAEGAGALPLAALEILSRKGALRGQKVALIVSGGNIDVNVLSRVIDRGLIREGRQLRVNVEILDRPGALARLTALIAEQDANIMQAIHDPTQPSIQMGYTAVALTLETKGHAHSASVLEVLRDHVVRLVIAH